MMYAILEGKTVKPVKDVLEFAKALESGSCHVGDDSKDGIRVSTVFLGIDHGFGGRPLWFETMIFGGEHDQYQERYETWEQAEEGHARALKLAFAQESEK